LKGLYEEGKDDFHSFGIIINKYGIPVQEITELSRLARRLEGDNLIAKPIVVKNDISAKLTSHGIDYCENDSYTYDGSPIINNNYNINVEKSADTTIINQSSDINVDKLNIIDTELNKIISYIENNEAIQKETREELIKKINNVMSNF
jgi:hypothetical protein